MTTSPTGATSPGPAPTAWDMRSRPTRKPGDQLPSARSNSWTWERYGTSENEGRRGGAPDEGSGRVARRRGDRPHRHGHHQRGRAGADHQRDTAEPTDSLSRGAGADRAGLLSSALAAARGPEPAVL